ncbi:MAG: YvcK family protein [Aerococcaceae bacterium]|nr:YvcK family protein [Aerococcaceae bacterium]
MTKKRHKVAVIGGGTGLPVILRGLKRLDADITAVVTVADDGGSSGIIRDYINIVPPGDIRNCMCALSDAEELLLNIFQYRFNSDDDFLAGHAIGNFLIAALNEMQGSMTEALTILSRYMKVQGQILPAANEPLTLHARFEDGTIEHGESHIAKHRKKIEAVWLTTHDRKPAIEATDKVVDAIMEADLIVLGPGSLYTSILPNLMIQQIGDAVRETPAEVVYICNIMTQLGETENFTDADHVNVLHQHLGQRFIDTVLVNTTEVPEDYIRNQQNEEYLLQVAHDFKGLRAHGCRVISNNFLSMKNGGAYHDTDLVVSELRHLLATGKLNRKNTRLS